ncbi:hypothetical protein pb186bvf_011805 [Paramecium bursaria]
MTEEQKGVCFISHLPPKINVTKIRELLQPYGIDRVYFETSNQNNKRQYTQGWVEFNDKKVARMTAIALNGTNMQQKKRSQFSDYTWQIKYLPKFTWETLTENFNYEKRISKQRLDMEMNQAKKNRMIFLYICLVQSLDIDVNLIGNSNTKKVIKNGNLQKEFDYEEIKSRQTCKPLQLVYLENDSGKNQQEQQFVVLNNQENELTLQNVNVQSKTPSAIEIITTFIGPKPIEPNKEQSFSITHLCERAINNEEFWAIVEVSLQFRGYSVQTFEYEFACDPDYRSVHFDWSLIVLILISLVFMTIMALFSKIYSIKWIKQGTQFQGFKIQLKSTIIYISIYLFFAILLILFKFASAIRYIALVFIFIFGSLSSFFIWNEIIFCFAASTILTKSLFSIVKVGHLISLALTAALIFTFIFTKYWFIGDFLSVFIIGTIVKLFKLPNLKNAFIFMVPIMLVDIFLAILVHFTQYQSYNILTLKYLNCPLEIVVPLFELQFSKNCAWISLFNIAIPGLLCGLSYRFDRNRNTNIYLPVAFFSLAFAELLWILCTVSLNHSWPQSTFIFTLMLAAISIIALRRSELKQIWTGKFYDEYLQRSLLGQSNVEDESAAAVLFSMNLFEGIVQDESPSKKRRQSTDL